MIVLFRRSFYSSARACLRGTLQLCEHHKKNYAHLTKPNFDLEKFLNPLHVQEIKENLKNRKGAIANIDEIQKLISLLQTSNDRKKIEDELSHLLMNLPNSSHPQLIKYGDEPKVTEVVGNKIDYKFDIKQFHQISEHVNGLRTNRLGLFVGPRSYYLKGIISDLENALVKFTLDYLINTKQFTLVSVPDILPPELIQRCGMNVEGQRTQVYKLNNCYDDDGLCLSGTSEMALASLFSGEVLQEDSLPVKLASVSRCYRAEVSNIIEENGIFRVHQFTKVEMFGLTKGEVQESENLLQEFVSIQKELFSSLGLHFKVLDMPIHELGAPAYRKFDIEAWMPGRQMFGEISSASNCTDYQSRRHGIRYNKTSNPDGEDYVHTINGTACAIPRMLIAILETYQDQNGFFEIPSKLKPYMSDQNQMPNLKMKLIKELPEIVL